MNSTLALLWLLGIVSGGFLGYRLLIALRHLMVVRFGVESTAFVINAQRAEKDGNIYLHGHYVFTDAAGHEFTFAFTICADWPGDEQWRKLMRAYAQGRRNPVRYLPWLPTFHEVQLPT